MSLLAPLPADDGELLECAGFDPRITDEESLFPEDCWLRRISGEQAVLFGGGRADLLLMPDENGNTDWLESGIEVIAKPPGKEPQTIRLLSGGDL